MRGGDAGGSGRSFCSFVGGGLVVWRSEEVVDVARNQAIATPQDVLPRGSRPSRRLRPAVAGPRNPPPTTEGRHGGAPFLLPFPPHTAHPRSLPFSGCLPRRSRSSRLVSFSLRPSSPLTFPDNSRVELPEPLHAVLVQVAEALMQGMAVSVIPQSARLTTQQAADFLLGVSRPTLVRLLERGEIPMSKPGRHRYVQLQDLVIYQDAMQSRRREILDTMAREAVEAGLYEATDGPPPALR